MAKWSNEKMADLTRRLADTAIDYKQRCEELEERLEAAQRDAKEAEAYAEEMEDKLAQQDNLVQAAVAAALREAAKEAKTYFIGAGGEDIAGREVRAGAEISRAILALITEDAQAALDRTIAAAIRKGGE